MVSVVVIMGAVALSGGIFFYASYNDRQLTAAQQELAEKRQLFTPGSIEDLQDLDRRIATAQTLIDSHVSPSLLLDTLERTTQRDVQFTGFMFERRPSGNIGVELTGRALRFNTVALQAERYAAETLFSDVIFHDLGRTEGGTVTFAVNLELAALALAYQAAEPAPLPDDFEVEELLPEPPNPSS